MSKDYKIEYTYEKKFLHAKITGKESISTSFNYWVDLIEEARIKNYTSVFVEEHLEGDLSKSENFRLNKEISRLDYSHIKKVAFVDANLTHKEINDFGITQLLKAGLNIMLFNSDKEAIKWLQ